MAQKKVLISIPEELNDLWNDVTKKHRITKSGMVQHYLERVLNELNHANISDAKDYDTLLDIKEKDKSLFDYDERAIFDESFEEYKLGK